MPAIGGFTNTSLTTEIVLPCFINMKSLVLALALFGAVISPQQSPAQTVVQNHSWNDPYGILTSTDTGMAKKAIGELKTVSTSSTLCHSDRARTPSETIP